MAGPRATPTKTDPDSKATGVGNGMQGIVWLCAALLLSGCGGGDRPARAAATWDVQDTLAVSSDPELQARVAALLPGLAERAGLPLLRPVRVEWRSRPELEAYLLAQLEEELPVEEADHLTRAYSLLGLVPDTLDLRTLLIEVYKEQVAGFYDPDSLTLWIMDDQDEATIQNVLLHELVHAVQDQAFSLDEITAKEVGSDRRAAAQAAIEGHATLVMLEEIMGQAQGGAVDLTAIPDLANSLTPSQQDIEAQYPTLAQAPRVIQESLLFPYLAGAGFVLEFWKATGGRPAPFGDALPQSTEHILHPSSFLDTPRDEPISIVLDPAGAPIFQDELGELGVRVFLEEVIGSQFSDRAEGWGGDRFGLFAPEEGDGVAWFITWDSDQARNRFAEAVTRSDWASRSNARVEMMALNGRPAVRITVGVVHEAGASVSR